MKTAMFCLLFMGPLLGKGQSSIFDLDGIYDVRRERTLLEKIYDADHNRTFAFNDSLWSIQLHKRIDNSDHSVTLRAKILNSYDGNHWQVVSVDLPFEYGSHIHAVVFKDKIWLHDGDNNGVSFLWYSEDGRSWKKTKGNASFPPSLYRHGFDWVVFKDRLWVIGGRSQQGHAVGINAVYFTDNGEDWTLATNQISDQYTYFNRPRVLTFKDRMYIFGGIYDDWGWSDEENNKHVYSSEDGIHWDVYAFPFHEVLLTGVGLFVHQGRIWITTSKLGHHSKYEAFHISSKQPATLFSWNGRDWQVYSDKQGDPFLMGYYPLFSARFDSHFISVRGKTIYLENGYRGDETEQAVEFLEFPVVVPFLTDYYVLPEEVAVLDIPFEVSYLNDPSITTFNVAVHSTRSDLISAKNVSIVKTGDRHVLRLEPSTSATVGMSTKLTVSVSHGSETRKQHFNYRVIANEELYLFPLKDLHFQIGEDPSENNHIALTKFLSVRDTDKIKYSLKDHSAPQGGVVISITDVFPTDIIPGFYNLDISTATAGASELVGKIRDVSRGLNSQQRFRVIVSDQSPPAEPDLSDDHAFDFSFGASPVSSSVVTITAEDASVVEGQDAVFTLMRTDPITEALTVNVTVAQEGDFISAVGAQTAVFAAGLNTLSLTVSTLDDEEDEPDGRIIVTVESGTNYTPGSQGSAMVTVTDEDEPLLGLQLQEQVMLYPNPTRGSLYFRLPKDAGYFKIAVYNLSGTCKLLREAKAGQSFFSMDFSNFSSGIYIVKIEGDNGKIITHKVSRR